MQFTEHWTESEQRCLDGDGMLVCRLCGPVIVWLSGICSSLPLLKSQEKSVPRLPAQEEIQMQNLKYGFYCIRIASTPS